MLEYCFIYYIYSYFGIVFVIWYNSYGNKKINLWQKESLRMF